MDKIFLNDTDDIHQVNHTLHVDHQAGDDSNSGSSYHPFRTLFKAGDAIPSGGLINMSNGVHIEMAGGIVDKDDIIVQGHGHASVSTLQIYRARNIKVKDIYFERPGYMQYNQTGGLCIHGGYIGPDMFIEIEDMDGDVTFKDCQLACSIRAIGPSNGHKIYIIGNSDSRLNLVQAFSETDVVFVLIDSVFNDVREII